MNRAIRKRQTFMYFLVSFPLSHIFHVKWLFRLLLHRTLSANLISSTFFERYNTKISFLFFSFFFANIRYALFLCNLELYFYILCTLFFVLSSNFTVINIFKIESSLFELLEFLERSSLSKVSVYGRISVEKYTMQEEK